MRIHELITKPTKDKRRSGRGISAGRGKTAGRGTKGQNSRTGGGVRPGFEGGQNPLTGRIPKLAGFKSRRPKTQTVTLSSIDRVKSKEVNVDTLYEMSIISSLYLPVKLVASGKITNAKTVELQGASQKAISAIETAGGSFKKVNTLLKRKRSSE